MLLLFIPIFYTVTSAKTRWAFEVITPPPQGGIYISKINQIVVQRYDVEMSG